MSFRAGTRDAEGGRLSERVLGDFVLRELVGAGGFGDVYLAEQQTLHREAVVKVLRTDGSHGQRVEEFLREAKLASTLDHPYAAHIYAFGAEPDGVCWIAMELVRGSSLRAILEAQGPMPLERFVPLLDRICEVVHTAHEQGIVHRDLKPDNVMVISRAGRLLPKLLDFGIAHAMIDPKLEPRPSASPTLGVRGSPLYMAPELWIDPNNASPAVDQYAIGALTYEALTGRFAFPGRTVLEIARAHARPSRRPLGVGLPAALEAVLDRALARRAADRYANVLELAQAFRDASGIGKTTLELPHLDEDLRQRLLARAPQPIADSVAAYDTARNAHQAREALRALARVTGWYVALLALACRTRIGAGAAGDSEATRALIADLRRHGLTPAGWTALAKQLTKPFAAAPDTYPLPELVLLLHPPSGPDVFATILQSSLAESLSDSSEEAAAQAIARELPQVTALLRASAFLLDYLLVVKRGDRGEAWMGARGARKIVPLARELPEGWVVLADAEGVPLLVLWPLLQVTEPVPGHGQQLFLLSGPGRQGARLLSAPHGFEHHDNEVWEWFRDELFERSEDETSLSRGNPYRGLLPYRTTDAAWFFGRERESEVMVNRLKLEPFVAVVGPSGVGKSSLVHAGVAPALEWKVISMRPGRAPLVQLADRLAGAKIEIGDLTEGEIPVLAERLRGAAAELKGLLLVVDQFEEILTLGCSAAERDRFVRLLLAAAVASEAALAIVITVRDDFLIRIEQLPGFGPVLARGIQLLGPLGPEALERIIVEPARRFGYEFEEPALPARMVESVAGTPAAVALISFAATRLWELRDRHFHQLSTKAYDAIGGVTGALARHANETVDAMPAAERQLVRKAFRHLVTFEGTRAVLEREELIQLLGAGEEAERLIERLIEARLLVSSENDRGAGVVEIVHEALIREWPRLAEWRREDVEGSRFHEQLRAAARQWHDRGRPRGLLWRGDALAEYTIWRKRHAPSLTPLEAAFGETSTADAARGRRIRRWIAAAAIAVTAVFLVALWRANLAANDAKRAAEGLLRDSYLEQGRLRVLEGDKLGALAPLATAYRMGSTGATTRLLLEEATRPTRTRLLALAGHADKLWDIAYSPDGKWLATASSDHTARIWDAATGALRAMVKHAERVSTVAWSPDSRLLVSSAADRFVHVWDVIAGRELAALPAGVPSRLVAFSPDGALLLTGAAPGAIKLWRMPGGTPAGELGGHGDIQGATFCRSGACIAVWDKEKLVVWDVITRQPRVSYPQQGNVLSAAVSRTGALIAVGTENGVLTLLRGDGTPIRSFKAHDDRIFDIAISPDETLVATGSSDRTARLWAPDATPHSVLAGHRANVTRVRFTPAGNRLVTTSADNTARLWSTSGMLLGEMTGHTNLVMAAAVRPDGAHLATASWDHTAMVWDLERAQELRPILPARDGIRPAPVTGWDPSLPIVPTAAFDPGGRRIAAARADGALVIADVETAAAACTTIAGAAIYQLTWTGARELAVLRPSEHNVELWDTRRCAVSSVLPHPAPVKLMSARSGPRLATAADNIVRVFRDGRLEATFSGYPSPIRGVGIEGDEVYAVTQSPSTVVIDAIGAPARRRSFGPATFPITRVQIDREQGRILATSLDQFLYVWDARTGALVHKLEGTGPLWAVRTSPDGAIMIGVGGISPAVWDRTTGAKLGQLEGHSELARDGEFIDDRLFVSIAVNRTAIVWDVAAARPLARFHDVEAMALSDDRRSVALVGATGVRIWSPRTPSPDLGALRALHLNLD